MGHGYERIVDHLPPRGPHGWARPRLPRVSVSMWTRTGCMGTADPWTLQVGTQYSAPHLSHSYRMITLPPYLVNPVP